MHPDITFYVYRVPVTTHNLISQATFMTNPDSVKESINKFYQVTENRCSTGGEYWSKYSGIPSIGRFIPRKFC